MDPSLYRSFFGFSGSVCAVMVMLDLEFGRAWISWNGFLSAWSAVSDLDESVVLVELSDDIDPAVVALGIVEKLVDVLSRDSKFGKDEISGNDGVSSK